MPQQLYSAHSDFVGSSCNLPPALLSFTCYCGNTEVERTPNYSTHRKLTLERKKKLSLCSCRGSNPATFRSRVQRALPGELSRPHNSCFLHYIARSVKRNEGFVPRGCGHAARGSRPSFPALYCRCLGKHSQTETGFKTNFLPMKGENSTTSYCAVSTFKTAEIRWLFKEILVF